jgi:protoporphyrinogen oxidase
VQLKQSLSKYYWTTVAEYDDRAGLAVPFVAVIEHTNIMPKEMYGGANIVYLTRYLDETDKLYKASDEEIKDIFCQGLKKLYEHFSEDDVIDFSVYRSRYSQPVVSLRYSEIIPEFETPVSGLYLSSMAQIYPEDRGQNYAIRAGRNIAEFIEGSI